MENKQQPSKMISSKPLWIIGMINMIGRLLRSIGMRVGDADTEAIIKKAMKKSEIISIIDYSFREPLDVLVQSANQQPSFSFVGRLSFRNIMIGLVSNRLKIDATLAAFPDIMERPIERPIFIAALPRTGTTILHRLFAQDASLRIPKSWEMLYPCPPPKKETYATDPQIQKVEQKLARLYKIVPQINRIHEVEQELARLYKIAPQIKRIHEVGAHLPEECIFLFANDLMGDWFNTVFDLPGYLQWLNQQNLLFMYERHKKQLQVLQYHYPGERWVLKAPAHLRDLPSLMQTYPDAYIIQTHRDPSEVISSVASLEMAFRSVFHDDIRPEEIGQKMLELIGSWIDRSMAAREQAESDPDSQVRFLDINYKYLVTDPIGTIRNFYNQCDLTWSPLVEQQMTAFLEKNRQHKHGKHRYSLEQFGLKKDQVHERFAAYNQRFLGQS